MAISNLKWLIIKSGSAKVKALMRLAIFLADLLIKSLKNIEKINFKSNDLMYIYELNKILYKVYFFCYFSLKILYNKNYNFLSFFLKNHWCY